MRLLLPCEPTTGSLPARALAWPFKQEGFTIGLPAARLGVGNPPAAVLAASLVVLFPGVALRTTGGEPLAAPRRPSAPARTGQEEPQPAAFASTEPAPNSPLRSSSRRWCTIWNPGGRRWPSSPLCTQCGAPLRGPRAGGALAQHGAHSSAFPANAVRLTLWRASLRDIRPSAERRLPLYVR